MLGIDIHIQITFCAWCFNCHYSKCLINVAMFSGCIIKVNIDWNWNIDSRDNGKIDIAPLHSYFPKYTLLSKSVISKEGNYPFALIGNYQLLRDFDRTENAESAISKIFDLRYLRNYTFTT